MTTLLSFYGFPIGDSSSNRTIMKKKKRPKLKHLLKCLQYHFWEGFLFKIENELIVA